MLASLVATNMPDAIHVHLLHGAALSAQSLDALRRLVLASGARFHARLVPLDVGSVWPGSERFPVNAWYRVRLPELLPEVQRVLYIDADTLITAAIEDLWATDLDGALVGAVTNPLYDNMLPRI